MLPSIFWFFLPKHDDAESFSEKPYWKKVSNSLKANPPHFQRFSHFSLPLPHIKFLRVNVLIVTCNFFISSTAVRFIDVMCFRDPFQKYHFVGVVLTGLFLINLLLYLLLKFINKGNKSLTSMSNKNKGGWLWVTEIALILLFLSFVRKNIFTYFENLH
jgi:hypothetical protein